MSNLIIAAIPDESDRVWQVSSEKVPHLTILHLGDSEKISNLEQIMLFVEHAAARSLKRFYLPVDRRGELGEAKADVLFFKKGRYDFKAVRDFRNLLLQDQNIKSAYDAASQFEAPEQVGLAGQPWIPHLTLGYPATPAKPIPDDHISNFYDISFNKIAVWPGDFEGPDFLLKDYWEEFDEMGIDMDTPLAMSGVKGMKWGVRKQEVGSGGHIKINQKTGRASVSGSTTAAIVIPAVVFLPLTPLAFLSPRVRAEMKAAKAINKGVAADKKWNKALNSVEKHVEVHNAAADEFNAKIGAFNKDKRWDGINLNKDPAKMKEYEDAVERELLNPGYARAAIKVHGEKSPGGRYKFEITDHDTGAMTITDTLREKTVEHAAEDKITVEFKISRDANGHIIGFIPKDDGMVHTVDLGAAFLEHHGVKGMKWGERKEDFERAAGSSNSPIAKKMLETSRFIDDVDFESRSRSTRDEDGFSRDSDAKTSVIDKAHVDFRGKDLPAIKAKPEYVRASKLRNRLLHPKDPVTKAYRTEVKKTYIDRLEKTANSMKNASGTREYTIRDHDGGLTTSKYYWEVRTREARHAEKDDFVLLEVLMDDDGFITGTKVAEESLAQTIELGMEFLEHFGVKGMKWGQRKSGPPVAVATSATSVVPHGTKRKTKIKTEGGENHDASPDAIKVAESHAKLKKSGLAALSNKDLQELQTRLNLEKNVKQLVGDRTKFGTGRKFVKDLTGFNKDVNDTVGTGLQSARLAKQFG